MKKLIAFISIALMSAVLGVNVYTSVVDAKNWGASIPQSIVAARAYLTVANPGTFFRLMSPLNELFALLALAVGWRTGRRAMVCFGLAFLMAVLAEALTFGYFFPRNAVLFGGNELKADVLTRVWTEWSRMNWVRSALLAVGLVGSMKGLDALYETPSRP